MGGEDTKEAGENCWGFNAGHGRANLSTLRFYIVSAQKRTLV